jgi:F-type H+-transporting ATPase subunit b
LTPAARASQAGDKAVNINLTLIVQMIVFILLIWFTMRVVWPMILEPMNERETRIAKGLAAAEQGEKELAEARGKADAIVRAARERANQIIDHAQHRANELVEQAKGTATNEGARLVAAAQQQIQLETTRARESLRREVAGIAVNAASKLLGREIDARAHADLLDNLAAQI